MFEIIILEDQPSKANKVNDLLLESFEDINIEIACVKVEARKKMQEKKYDLLILDMQIPERQGMEPAIKGGLSFLNEFKISSRIKKPNHIIGLTAYDDYRKEFADQWQCIKYEEDSETWQNTLLDKVKYIIDSKREDSNNSIRKIIVDGENNEIEFKATIQFPVSYEDNTNKIIYKEKAYKRMIEANKHEAASIIKEEIEKLRKNTTNPKYLQDLVNESFLKELVAFANSNGGKLIIGVMDDKTISGIEPDLKIFKDHDKMLLRLDELISNRIGNYFQELLSHDFINIEGKVILLIKVSKAKEPVFLKVKIDGNEKKEFYIRAQASARKLEGEELVKFIMEHFKSRI